MLAIIITTCQKKMLSYQNGYKCLQVKDSCGIKLKQCLENKAVEKVSVKRDDPRVATDLLEGASVYGMATC